MEWVQAGSRNRCSWHDSEGVGDYSYVFIIGVEMLNSFMIISETEGLSKMTRNHIHFAQGVPGTGVISGKL